MPLGRFLGQRFHEPCWVHFHVPQLDEHLEHLGQGGPKDKPKTKPVRKRTINSALQTVRHILNLAASEWHDETGKTWLLHAPKIKLLKEDDKKKALPPLMGGTSQTLC